MKHSFDAKPLRVAVFELLAYSLRGERDLSLSQLGTQFTMVSLETYFADMLKLGQSASANRLPSGECPKSEGNFTLVILQTCLGSVLELSLRSWLTSCGRVH